MIDDGYKEVWKISYQVGDQSNFIAWLRFQPRFKASAQSQEIYKYGVLMAFPTKCQKIFRTQRRFSLCRKLFKVHIFITKAAESINNESSDVCKGKDSPAKMAAMVNERIWKHPVENHLVCTKRKLKYTHGFFLAPCWRASLRRRFASMMIWSRWRVKRPDEETVSYFHLKFRKIISKWD